MSPTTKIKLLFILLQLSLTASAEDSVYPKVTKIEPQEASYKGGTRLYIYGQGFSSSGNFNSLQGQSKVGNSAFLISDLETVPCDVENDASHETMIVCYTRPMKQNNHYFIQVEVDGYEVPFSENCNRNPRNWRCRFIPRWWRTPYLRTCHVTQEDEQYPMQTSHAPGSLITCSGRIFTQIYGSNNQTNENGRTVSIRRVYAGGQTCELLREPDVFYDLRLTSGDEGTFTCKTKGTFIGVQNVSLILTDEFGRTEIAKSIMKTNSKDKVYHFQTYAEITNVSPQVGSTEGGTRITINGRNFDDTTEPIQVFVGGVPCAVIPGTLTSERIECNAGDPPEEREYYTGSRGMLMEIWNETTVDNNEATLQLNSSASNYESAEVVDSTAWMWNNSKDHFVAKYTGVFVAPKTDRYMFKIAADDQASLYMNCEGSRKKENLTKIAYTDRPISTYSRPSQTSDWITLEKGQQCFFVGAMQEYAGIAYMYIAVHRASTTLTGTESVDAKNEIQIVDFHANFLKEKQVINFTEWSSQNGVAEEQEISVKHSCINSGDCSNIQYRLIYEGVKTTFIAADASASTVRNALRDIFELSDEDVGVSVATSTGEMKYTLQFNGKRGDYSALSFEKYPASVQGLTISVDEKTVGVSERKTYKLRLAGRTTTAIAEDAGADAIQQALDATRVAYCPSFLLPDKRKSTVVTTIDYETTRFGNEWGSRKQDIEPFCGKTSILDCDYVFYAGRTADDEDKRHAAFNAAENKWLCLAHRGLMSEYWQLTGTFKGAGKKAIGGTHQFTNPLASHENQWRYSCIDLVQVIQSRDDFSHVDEVTISVIRFLRKDRYNHYYLDAITIGSSKTTADLEGVLGLRTPPALANGHPLAEVTVTNVEGQKAYEIEIETHKCGDDIPLISMAFTSIFQTQSDKQIQRESTWSSDTSFVTTRLVSGIAPMTGEFDLTVNFHDGRSYNVTEIPVEISTEKFADRLEVEVPGFGQANVWRGGSCHATDYGIEWLTNGGDKPQMDVHMRSISAASDISSRVVTRQDGGVLHHPATGDMIRLAYSEPQVEVLVNGYPSKCVGNCQFTTAEDATPVISSISPTSGSTDLGTSITITGTNLEAADATSTTVKIGEADCEVKINTATSIICDLGRGRLGTFDVAVNVGGKGYVTKLTEEVSIAFTISGGIFSIDPNNGFSSGGTEVVISGYGFSKNTVFTFQSAPCEVKTQNSTGVTCITPANPTGAGSVSVHASDEAVSLVDSVSFEYQVTDSVITTISPTTSLLSGGQNLTITGSNVGQEGIVIRVGQSQCKVLETSPSQVICVLPSLPADEYAVNIIISGRGYADTTTNSIPSISYVLEVDSISPEVVSMNGGTEIIIFGNGFDTDNIEVKFGDSVCEIDTITTTSVKCTTGRFTKVHIVTNGGRHPIQGHGFAWDQMVLHIDVGDTVMWNWEFHGAPGGWHYGAMVFTTSSADSDTYDEATFQSSTVKTEKGAYSYTFNSEGTFYISSGRVDHPDWGSIVMKQSIVVGPSKPNNHKLSITVAGHEAVYNTDGSALSRKKRSTCAGTISSINGCVPTAIANSLTGYFVTADKCYSPKISSITPNQGTIDTTITIEGEGFGSQNCANRVIIGAGYADKYECQVLTSSSTAITCKPDPTALTSINIAYYVKVSVDNIGDTNSVIQQDIDRRFTLLPSASSVSPVSGSLGGETLITISGSGFSSNAVELSATVSGYSCDIQSASYFEIQCRTPSSVTEGGQTVAVLVNGQAAECTGTCSFEYAAASTPTITNVAPTTAGAPDTEIVLTGTAFTAENTLVTVTIGENDCSVTASSPTEIRCSIAELPAGPHSLQLNIDGVGKAKFDGVSGNIASRAEITGMTPVNGSKAGGTLLTFAGNGFNAEDLKVKIGNTLCEIDMASVTNFMFKCITPAKSNGIKTVTLTANGQAYSNREFRYHNDLTPVITSITPSTGKSGDVVTITGSLFIPGDMTVSIGDASCAGISGDSISITCVLEEHVGGEYPVSASIGELGFASSAVLFNYTFSVTEVTPASGSHAGGDLLTISGQGFSDRAVVVICESVCEHGSMIPNSSINIQEISCRVASSLADDVDVDKACDITVSVDGQSVTRNGMYTFAADKTPRVTGINPLRGGTQGGTEVTIIGTLFDADDSKISVEIGGVVCDVSSSTATQIVCTTNSRGHSVKATVEVRIDGKGLAMNYGVEFHYVDVWSSTWTWGGLQPPVAGDFVVVPTGQTVLIDIDTPVLKMLLIQGGVVIFDEKDIHLETENILITDGGVLQIGTEEEPFEHKAVITLHGHLRSPELPIYGTKTIGVRNGTLDLHGRHVPITWTHLKETASAGARAIKLKEAVTWQVGDEIVIASTGDRHSQRETETAVISAISVDKMTLTLADSLNYTHISAAEQFDGVLLETRAEVGLLTRNIVVEGSKQMEWSKDKIPACEEGFDTGEFVTQTCFQGRFGEEEGSDQFGAQIMIHHKSPNLDIARARLEYIELRHVGQAFRLGRYPIHFHLLGDVNFNNYVRGCSIHHSFNRAVTIHNTHHLLIERNVIHNIMGGAVFIEDGIEHGNVIQYNLVLFCKQSTSLQNDDITPAAFWVTNPNNTLQHNVAAGGTHFGFWYRIHATPDGPSADPNICQQLHPVQKFQNNTVHSHGWFGLWVFQKYTPRGDGSCGSTTPTVAEYHSLTVWNCEKGAELVNVGAIKFFDFVMAHNSKAGVETKQVVDTKVKWGQIGTYNSFIIAHASALTEGGSTERGLILPFSEGYEVKNTKFINFDQSGTSAIGVTSIDGTCTVLCGGWEARFTNTSFQNSPNKAAFRWEHEVTLRDTDGTLSGNSQHSLIVPQNPTISLSDCPKLAGFDVGEFDGLVCDGSTKFHRVSWNQVLPTSLEAKNVTFTNAAGSSFIPFAKKRLTHTFGWMGTMKDGETYKWVFQNADHITNISYKSGFYNFEENDCVVVSHKLTQKPDKFEIAGNSEESAQDNMVTCSDNYHGDYYYDAATKTLFYIVSGRDRPSRKKRFATDSATEGAVNREINFRVYRCFYQDCIPPPDPNSQPPVRVRPEIFQIWHDSSYWTTNADGEYVGTVTGDGTTSHPPDSQDVRIDSGTWMVVKQDLPEINKLWIEGVLEIEWEDANLDVTLSATHIIIMGGRLIIGWEDALFRGIANIVLRGNHNTEDILLNGGINLGAKAIGVIGGLDLHGRERDLRTTHLAATLTVGQNVITVEGSPSDWVTGDEIVIATTSANPWETETFKIVSVSEKTITLNSTAQFEHMAETFSYTEGESTEKNYDIRAEVSVLTRNIKIIGEDYPNLFKESFGARVLIAGGGSGSDRGYARIQNVEFYHTGQEGYIDNYDPRYSLAFLNTGEVDSVKPSIVKRNTFHNGFNTAIGVFGASKLNVVDNTIHHTVGPGIRVDGSNIRLESNLVMLARTRSVYQDRQEDDIMLWKAAIEVNLATSLMLTGNVVAGSERAGYRIDGHDCSDLPGAEKVEWGWNTARATLQGVWMNKDGFASCSLISKFNIHNAFDYAVYYQGQGDVKMSDILITDSNFGFTAIVFEPPSSSHVMRTKRVTIENSTVVAVSEPGYCPTLPRGTDYLGNSGLARPKRRIGANEFTRAAILWPAFISGHNAAPSKPFLGSLSYPAIGGQTLVNNMTFVNFGDTSCSSDHSIFLTNLQIEDFLHPIATSNLRFVNSPENSYIHFHRPSLGKINPSDCVDMECDGMKKALILDKDGSMLGSASSTAIPQAEYEWNGDPRRGLGDYRIPKTLLAALGGSSIPVEDLLPHKGILRANTSSTNCVTMDAWHGYRCQGYHHAILVVESLDADTETRRLSPVALMADQYIDLNNGPQDHGWCAGYTCQERLSTFWIVVAMSKTYEMHFSGTAPQKLRLRLLNEDSSAKMVIKIYYSRPQRLDVYVGINYQRPLNFGMNEDGQEALLSETYPGQFLPTIHNYTGDNFYDRSAHTIHVTLGGGDTVVEIHEAPVVIISFNLPAVSPDEFFDNGKLVENLALFLNIPLYKIRLVNAVREGSTTGRRKRQGVDSYTATVEIGDPPAETIEDTSSPTTEEPVTGGTTPASTTDTLEELAESTAAITNALQEGTLNVALGTEVASLAVVGPRKLPERNANFTNSPDNLDSAEQYYVPAGLRVIQQPESGNAGSPLSTTLAVTGIDADGNDIILGHERDKWHATVTVENGDKTAALSGTTIASFEEGLATYEDLAISLPGSFVLRITVTYPKGQSALTVVTDPFTISAAIITTAVSTTSSVKGKPMEPPISNLAVIIACSVVGGFLVIAIIVALILKGPCSKNANSSKISHSDMQPARSSPPPYADNGLSTKSPPPTHNIYEEPQHPHAVMEDPKRPPPYYENPTVLPEKETAARA